MADFSKPVVGGLYTDILPGIVSTNTSLAVGLDGTTDTNLPDKTKRWNATNQYWEIYNATASTWGKLSTKYIINVDTVDSIHASTTATANQLLALDANKELPASITGDSDTVDSIHASATAVADELLALNASKKLPADITGDAATLNTFGASQTPIAGEILALDAQGNTAFPNKVNNGNYVITGVAPATSTTLSSDISVGYSIVNGYIVATPLTNHIYTASSDTYIFLDQDGTFTFSAVANGAAIPTKPADTIGVAKVITNATAVTGTIASYGNVANGYGALFNNIRGQANIANGYNALYNNTTGGGNNANGYNALYNNTTGYNNVANGIDALYENTTGYNNIAIGINCLHYSGTGYQNIAIGNSTNTLNSTDINEIIIGYNMSGKGSNTATIGNSYTGTLWWNATNLYYVNGAGTTTTIV